jgi:hypothetical protein
MTLWTLVQSVLLLVNGVAILNNERCLEKYGWGFSQMGTGDGSGPGHNALKNQVVGFLFAAQYMRVPLIFLNAVTVFVKLIFG